MKGSQETRWRCGDIAHRSSREAERRSARPLVLTPFSTRLPPELLHRLRVAAPQLGLRQGEITAAALDVFLAEEGF